MKLLHYTLHFDGVEIVKEIIHKVQGGMVWWVIQK